MSTREGAVDLELTMIPVEGDRRVLVVDDEEAVTEVLAGILRDTGFAVSTATDAERALDLLGAERFNVGIFDKNLPAMSGLELLRRARAMQPEIEVILVTAHASLETALDAIRNGAHDYMLKPFESLDAVIDQVTRAYEKQRLVHENRAVAEHMRVTHGELSRAIGEMGRTLERISSVGRTMDERVAALTRDLRLQNLEILKRERERGARLRAAAIELRAAIGALPPDPGPGASRLLEIARRVEALVPAEAADTSL